MNKVDWLFITNEAINSGLVSRYLVDCRHSRRYGFSNKILKTIRKFINSSIMLNFKFRLHLLLIAIYSWYKSRKIVCIK